MRIKWRLVVCFLLGMGGAAAIAAGPAAIVEQSDVAAGPLSATSYLSAGQIIHLQAHQSMTIAYFNSCIRDTVTGGTVTVGHVRSRVVGGMLHRERVRCHTIRATSLRRQAARQHEAALGAGRGDLSPVKAPLPQVLEESVEVTIYDCHPLIDVEGSHWLEIERLDQPSGPVNIGIAPDRLIRGEFLDLAGAGYELVPGGVYRATIQTESIIFRVDASAQNGTASLAGRVLRF